MQIEEEDVDEMGDEEDDTTSSDGDDDMDDDDDGDPSALFHVHDHSAPDIALNADAGAAISPLASETPLNAVPEQSPPHLSASSDSSFSGTLHTPNDDPDMTAEVSDPQAGGQRPVSRPTRMIVGRHIPAQRPGIRPQPAFIDPTGRPVYTGRSSTGSVSPTSRAYIDAALQSPTGEVNLDVSDDQVADEDDNDRDSSVQQSLYLGRSTHGSRSFPDPASDHVSQYHQMVAAGQIRPSASSAQIDNLIESMHQAQRAHASRTIAPEDEPVTALTEAGFSNVCGPSSMETSSDNGRPEEL